MHRLTMINEVQTPVPGWRARAGGLTSLRPVALVAAVLAAGAGVPASAAEPAPPGYRVIARDAIARGLQHIALAGEGQRIHVAAMSRGAGLELRPILAGNRLGGAPAVERTSAMCARMECLAAVNGDFFSLAGPTGGVVANGEPVRSTHAQRGQLLVDDKGNVDTGALRFEVALISSDLQRIALDGVNVPLGRDATVLYTPRYGTSTRARRGAVELSVTLDRGGRRLRVGETVAARVEASNAAGDTGIPREGVVVSARGRTAKILRSLWDRIEHDRAAAAVLLRVDATPDAHESLGGRPVLIRNGKRLPIDERSSFASARHPRTIVGRTPGGDVLLVTVDGRQPGYSEGMTLREATDLMESLGAVEAINMDGGGSTTFVVADRVMNRPSDRVVQRGRVRMVVPAPRTSDRVLGNAERPVAVALAIVRSKGGARADAGVADARALGSVGSVLPVRLQPPTAQDPASRPDSDLPAIVVGVQSTPRAREVPLVLAAMLLTLAAIASARVAPQSMRTRASGVTSSNER